MSIKLMSCAWELDIPSTDKMVLLCLCDFANDFGLSCYPSVKLLAKKCSNEPRTVQRALGRLEESGFIERIERPGTSSEYKLDVGKIVTPDILSPLTETTGRGGRESPKPSITTNKTKKGAHALPEDWKPSAFGNETQCHKIVSRWSADEFARQVELFRAHHAKLGNEFADWQAAWKTWVLRSLDNRAGPSGAGPRPESQGSLADQVLRRGKRGDGRGGEMAE